MKICKLINTELKSRGYKLNNDGKIELHMTLMKSSCSKKV